MTRPHAPTPRRWRARLGVGALPLLLLAGACAPAAQPAPTTAPAKPTTAAAAPSPSPTAPVAAAPAASPVASPATAPAASPAAKPAASPAAMASPSPMASAMAEAPIKTAADLRRTLNNLLKEHEYLAGAATGAALGGREDEFKAAAATLDTNSVALSRVIGAAYGGQAEQTFLQLWRAHIGMFVEYTQGVAANDAAKKQKARADLDGYRRDFDAFITGANPNLPKGAVAELLVPHVALTTAAIDAQGAKDAPTAFAKLKEAADHMHMIADPLAAAVAKQFPDKFPMAADSKAADLQSTLNQSLLEHEYLAGFATGAALGGRDEEFKAAAAALDANTVGLGKAIGSVYGPQAEQTFLQLWRAHIGMFVEYTQGVAKNDQAMKQKARSDLDGYRRDFDAFITGANPNLPRGAVAELLAPHVALTTQAIDAQGAKNPTEAFTRLRQAAGHMHMIADPLAAAIVKQFPDKFPS